MQTYYGLTKMCYGIGAKNNFNNNNERPSLTTQLENTKPHRLGIHSLVAMCVSHTRRSPYEDLCPALR